MLIENFQTETLILILTAIDEGQLVSRLWPEHSIKSNVSFKPSLISHCL